MMARNLEFCIAQRNTLANSHAETPCKIALRHYTINPIRSDKASASGSGGPSVTAP